MAWLLLDSELVEQNVHAAIQKEAGRKVSVDATLKVSWRDNRVLIDADGGT